MQNIHILKTGELQVNTVILTNKNNEAIIFDPGNDFELITSYIEKINAKPTMILNTHGHFDHVSTVVDVCAKYSIPFHISKEDTEYVKRANISTQEFGLDSIKIPEDKDIHTDLITDGKTITFGEFTILCLHTPGHTPGGYCFYIKELASVITGDTLFYGTTGRTDFVGGNFDDIVKSIRTKLYTLPDDTVVIPGHANNTSIGLEKQINKVVRA